MYSRRPITKPTETHHLFPYINPPHIHFISIHSFISTTTTTTTTMSNSQTDPVTTKLQLAHHQSAAALDKEAVLWRIRYHKCLRKVKGTIESMAKNRSQSDHAYEKWSEPTDVFTSP